MQCEHVRQQLSAFQDGELGPEETRAMQAHLRDCPACREHLAELESTWELLALYPGAEPRREYRVELRGRLAAEARPVSLRAQRKVWALGAVAATVLLAFALFAALSGGPEPEPADAADLVPVVLPGQSTPEELEASLLAEAAEDPAILEILHDLEFYEAGEALEDMELIEAAAPQEGEGVTAEEAALLFLLDDEAWEGER